MAEPRTRVGASVPPLAALRSAGGEERAVRLQDGLGASELFRAVEGGGAARLFLRAAELVCLAAAEHKAARESVAVFDLTSFSKFLLQGRDAGSALQYLCANNLDIPIGGSAYTGLLNQRGNFESDLTVSRIGDDRFLIVTGTAQATRDADWIRCSLLEGKQVHLTDVTSAYAVLAVMGPRSRELLSTITRAPLDNAAFPFGAVREIGIGPAAVIAARRTYVGELGWELYVPVELAAGVYDALMQAGAPFGAKDAGYYAIDSLRLEKGYRAWGRELTPDYNPYEAGLSFAVDLDKGDFLGRAALIAAEGQAIVAAPAEFHRDDGRHAARAWRRAYFAQRRTAGEVTSASYGHTLGGIVALGYVTTGGAAVDAEFLSARFELDIAGDRVPVKASLKAPYDPANARVKG